MTAPARSRILLVGVGGHGLVTAAHMIAHAALADGVGVCIGQLHGMSQRGGSVETTVVLGPGQTAFIGPEQADVVVAFEPLEALRALPRMSSRTAIVLNHNRVSPTGMTWRGDDYPPLDEVVTKVRNLAQSTFVFDASALAVETGEPRTISVVMIGVMVELGLLPMLSGRAIENAVREQCPPRSVAVNQRALTMGRLAVTNQVDPEPRKQVHR